MLMRWWTVLRFFSERPPSRQTLNPLCALNVLLPPARREWPPCVPSRYPLTPRHHAAAADVSLSWSRSPWSAGDENYARSTLCPSTTTTRTPRPHQVGPSSWAIFPALFVAYIYCCVVWVCLWMSIFLNFWNNVYVYHEYIFAVSL